MRLVFIVEGDCEIMLIQKLVIPYLISNGITMMMHPQSIITNRKQHKKGGVTNYQLLKNEIERTFAQGNVYITTFLDFYGLPTNFPNYTKDSHKISEIESGILNDFKNNSNLIPYIQRHELESLFFSNRDGLEFVIDDQNLMTKIDDIISQYKNPEDINNSPETAPSKRLESIFDYDKTNDSNDIFELLTIEQIMDKCPRFKQWINTLLIKLG